MFVRDAIHGQDAQTRWLISSVQLWTRCNPKQNYRHKNSPIAKLYKELRNKIMQPYAISIIKF